MQPPGTARGTAHWTFVAVLIAALVGMWGLREFTTPDPRGHSTHEQFGLPACMLLKFTGVPCPACGLTTALSCVAHGEFLTALKVQPFGVLLALGLGVCSVFALSETLRGRDAWLGFCRRWRPWMSWCAAALMLAAWGYKIVALRA